jgi:hypothetical protein
LVILPTGADGAYPHAASMTGAHLDRTLDGVEVSFCYFDGETPFPIDGAAASESPSADRLLDVTTVLGAGVTVSPALIETFPLPDVISTRVLLPHGRGSALKARKKDAKDARWSLPAVAGLAAVNARELTDRIRIDVPVEDRPIYAAFRSPEGTTYERMESLYQGDYWVTFRNFDKGCDGQESPKPGKYELDEYRVLYALTTGDPAAFRSPEGYYGDPTEDWAEESNCRPICGGVGCPRP